MSRSAASAVRADAPLRVLLIEDDEDDYVLTRALLGEIAETSFDVDWRSTVADAREALRQGDHDICLLDYRLGRDNGLELLAEAHAAGYDVPVIVLTGQGNREVDLAAMRAGAAYYLAKAGIDAPSLDRSIRYALELHRAEQRARDSEARMRAVLEHAVDGIITIDEQGAIETFNPAAERLFGYPAAEVIGRNIRMLVAEPHQDAHDGYLRAYLTTGVARVIGIGREVVGRRKDGSTLPIELAVGEMMVHGDRKFIGSLRDVSARRRAEAALRESEQRLQLSVEAAGIGLWDWDLAGGGVYYSPQWLAQLGYAAEDLAMHPGLWAELLHPDDRAGATARLRAHVDGGGGSFEDEFRLRHRDGSYRWIHSRSAIYRDAAGAAVRMLGVHVDITRRRTAEESTRKLNAELERRVAERTEELAAANRELEAFSYSVSHDLRAPLRAIDGFAGALAEEYGATLPAAAGDYLARVRAGASRMSVLIDDLLQLARVTRSSIRRRPVDLSRLAQEIADELRRKEPERVVEFAIEPGLMVEGDPTLLRQALENLIGNAWKYTGKRAAAHIAVASRSDDGERVYYVRDDGAGFDPTYAAEMFAAFRRLHPTGEFEGTGVGLAIVQRIIQRHGGRVWAEGEVERGATFSFTLGSVGGGG